MERGRGVILDGVTAKDGKLPVESLTVASSPKDIRLARQASRCT